MKQLPFPFYDGDIAELIRRGALFVVSHSGGKDSQAMMIKLAAMIPARQLLVIHADLPEVDWPGIDEQIEKNLNGVPYLKCRSVKTFFEMVEHRGMFPSPANRQCTSDLKRGPIEREIRRYLKAHPEFNNLVVSCEGMRADESPKRSRLPVFQFDRKNSKAGREWFRWLPVHDLSEAEVYASIAEAGQTPHWAYTAGMSRLSCCFCIMASRQDLTTAARLQPALFARVVATEKRIGHTLMMPAQGKAPLGLEEITGISAQHSKAA